MKQSPSISLLDQALAKPSSLYLIATQGDRSIGDHLAHVEAALKGGVDLVQMREKGRAPADLLDLGHRLMQLCHSHRVPFIVNDLAQVASAIKADGVHLGQDDMSAKKARKLIGSGCKIGLSTHSLKQIETAAKNSDVAMLGFGPIFPTKTKDAGPALGASNLKEALAAAGQLPLWAIGGICLENLGSLVAFGCRRVAVSSLIMDAVDPNSVANQAKSLLVF